MHSGTPTWHASPTTVGLSNLKITIIYFKNIPYIYTNDTSCNMYISHDPSCKNGLIRD
jgi:hypothetical protein